DRLKSGRTLTIRTFRIADKPGGTMGNQRHLPPTRREALKAGAIGLLGLSMGELSALQAGSLQAPRARSVIFVFLTGGLSHHDSFDLKPDAPETVRGEFNPIATRTTGIRICEHLPMLADRTDKYAIIRSMATGSDGHEV